MNAKLVTISTLLVLSVLLAACQPAAPPTTTVAVAPSSAPAVAPSSAPAVAPTTAPAVGHYLIGYMAPNSA